MASGSAEIEGFSELYERMVGDRPFLGSLLTGHLAIEFLLGRLIAQYDVKLAQHAETLRHRALIALNHEIGTIDEAQRDVLVSINRIRNKLAHEITFEPSLHEMRQLWGAASAAFDDLTDGISQGIEALASAAAFDQVEGWVCSELFVQICYDLHEEYVRRGGDVEAFMARP